MATKVGIVKKTNLGEYANPRKGSVIGIKIEKGDRLIGVKLTSGNNENVHDSDAKLGRISLHAQKVPLPEIPARHDESRNCRQGCHLVF